jgi:hypothetical protein
MPRLRMSGAYLLSSICHYNMDRELPFTNFRILLSYTLFCQLISEFPMFVTV